MRSVSSASPGLPVTLISVAVACLLVPRVCVAQFPADVLFHEDFEFPVVSGYEEGARPDIWVGAYYGYGAVQNGLINKDRGAFTAPEDNDQAYAFRYSNSGLTSGEGWLCPPLAFGGGYEVSFDVVRDPAYLGVGYNVQLIAFAEGAARDDCRSTPAGCTVLASTSGEAPSDGSWGTVTFQFIPDATTHAAEFGKDLGIRFIGSFNTAIVDNVTLRAIPGNSPGVNVVTTEPLDGSYGFRIYNPMRIVFNKNIAAGSGNITLRNVTDTIDTVIPINDPRIAIDGVCLTIDPGNEPAWGKEYVVLIDSGAIEDTLGNSFTGISDPTNWNFTTNGGDPLLFSIAQLKDHILGNTTLTAGEIEICKRDIDSLLGRFAESEETISALFDLVETYDTGPGPLFVSRNLPNRSNVTNDLHWTIYGVMQGIMDRIYNSETLTAHEALLNGFKFGSSAHFPGPCDPPADPSNVHTVTINGSFPVTFGRNTQDWTKPARKPTGTYLAPGTIATVTAPASLVNAGCQVRVGAHSWDLKKREPIKRLERASLVYDITSTETRIANPYGGGIYIEVPIGADAGPVDISITGAVRSPYFSAKSFHMTSEADWENEERGHPGPWADFQSEKFMVQVPRTWIYNMTGAQAVQMMADWDTAMDAITSLMGFPNTRGKETMYCQVDLVMRASVHAPGYPAVNQTDGNPTVDDNGGYAGSYLVRGPGASPTAAHVEFHEQGHAFGFPKFGSETESNVNLLHPAMLNREFGYSFDVAHAGSLGSSNAARTIDNTAVAWMCCFFFSPYEAPMASTQKQYQHKGHAKFMDVARLFGWDVLDDYWRSFMEDDANGIPYGTSDDDKLLRLSRNVGWDIRPLFHFWGLPPQDNAALDAALDAENIPPSDEILDQLVHYLTIVPADNAAFQSFAQAWWGRQPSIAGGWEEREHARQWDTAELYEDAGDPAPVRSAATNPGEIYNEHTAADIRARVQELIALYFPGAISPDPPWFDESPAAYTFDTIRMVATTVMASESPVEYYFENLTNGDSRNWSPDRVWENGGLADGVSYAYRVKARNGLGDETNWSAEASAVIVPLIINGDFEDGLSGWTVSGTSGTDATVAAEAAAQSPIGAGTQGVALSDTSTSVGPPRIEQGISVASTSTVYLQFDFKSDGEVSNAGLLLGNGTQIRGLNLHLMGQGDNANEVQLNQQGIGWGNVGTELAQDTWYRFTLTVAPANSAVDSFDLRIQSLESTTLDVTYTNLLFQNNLDEFSRIWFHFNTGAPVANGRYFVDNVLVTTNPGDLDFSIVASELKLDGFSYDPSTGDSEVSIAGAPGTRYKLVEAADVEFSSPDRGPVPLTGVTVGTQDGDRVVTDASGNATVQFNLGTTNDATFVRAEEAP